MSRRDGPGRGSRPGEMLEAGSSWRIFFLRVGWAPASVFLFHAAWANLISHPPVLDLWMHPLGGLAIAHAVHRALPMLRPVVGRLTTASHHLIVLGSSFVVANLWEYAEFLADVVFDSRIQTSVEETMIDLLLGTGAATLYVVASRLGGRAGDHEASGIGG